MKKKCILGFALVLTFSTASMAAFAFSFADVQKDKHDDIGSVIQVACSEVPVIPMATLAVTPTAITTVTPAATEIIPTETPATRELEIESEYFDTEDAYLLAKIAMAEAEGEDTEGKALVMLVVLNRVRNDRFPDSIEEVIFQKGQFSPVGNGRYESVEPNNDCYKALKLIKDKNWDESRGAVYFESKSDSKWHSENLTFLFRHGKHYFYREKE